MKIQIDTDNGNKIIRVEGSVNLNELFEHLKQMLPNDLWKEFILENTTIVNWRDPIIIHPIIYPSPSVPYTPPYYTRPYIGDPPPSTLPWITCGTNVMSCELKPGTYNVQI
jgi:hypothetical protein